MAKALQQAPWFINGHYLSVRRWGPNFVSSKAKEVYSAVWVHLPQLPTEFYDGIVLGRIGNSIGKLLRVDACTSSTIRGRYARLCVQVPLDQPVQTAIQIGSHIQQLLYEGENFLCKACGRLGHKAPSCSYPTIDTLKHTQEGPWVISSNSTDKGKAVEDQWQTVSFPKGNKHKRYTANSPKVKIQETPPGINVNIFDVTSGGRRCDDRRSEINAADAATGEGSRDGRSGSMQG
ncbi:PREDICTED: uncharacterized protein LOC109233709 [Nicotiana attenuata]|uniref:uncharacterized protein LOC109233709 n=1 Tax=Nicotiana attenuata TaxID=49451 RepID=UPI0009048B34|nr:PREDICTED: uncharacterized protein LOC109233709 [Nicotiana attenuata]